MLVQDERGHKFSMGVKGSGGLKLCALCKNVAAFKSTHLPDPTGFLIPSTSLDVSSFRQHSDEGVKAIQKRLHD
eukprot:1283078-Pyramimonas_sp.AAC.1